MSLADTSLSIIYPKITSIASSSGSSTSTMMDLIAYSDGENNLSDIGQIIGKSTQELIP